MFENPRRGRQARKFYISNCLPNRYFPKIDFGCPCHLITSSTELIEPSPLLILNHQKQITVYLALFTTNNTGFVLFWALLTFHDIFHDLLKFCTTLGLVVTIKNFQKISIIWGYFLTTNSSTDTKSVVHQNACRLRCLISPLHLTLSLLNLSSAVTKLPNKTLIFHDFQGPTIKFHDFPGLENKILKFHGFPGFPWPVRTL